MPPLAQTILECIREAHAEGFTLIGVTLELLVIPRMTLIPLPEAVIWLAESIALRGGDESIHAFELTMRGHYNAGLTTCHIETLLSAALDSDLLGTAEKRKLALSITQDGTLWCQTDRHLLRYEDENWALVATTEAVVRLRNLPEALRFIESASLN